MNYIVKTGDSLSKIARDRLGDITLWIELAKHNKIDNPDKIYPGQVLNLDIPKRTTIDVTTGTPRIIQDPTRATTVQRNGSIWEWVAGLGVALLAYGAWNRSKMKK